MDLCRERGDLIEMGYRNGTDRATVVGVIGGELATQRIERRKERLRAESAA